MTKRFAVAGLAAVLSLGLLSACEEEKPTPEQSMQDAGDHLNEAAKDTGQAIQTEAEKAGDAVGGALDKAGEAIEKTGENMQNGN